MERIKVMVPGAREKFEKWIAELGGVRVWKNQNLSNPGAGNKYTPGFMRDGSIPERPHWAYTNTEVIYDINRFVFVKEFKEVARFRVATRLSSNGTMVKCTDGSTRKIERSLNAHPGAVYRFENQEVIIEMPEYEP